MADEPIEGKGTQFDLGHIYPGLRFDFRQDHDHINQNLIVDGTNLKFEERMDIPSSERIIMDSMRPSRPAFGGDYADYYRDNQPK